MRRTTYSGLALAAMVLGGCAVNPPAGNPIPWWKGIPTQILAPSSLEAMAWQGYHQGRPVPELRSDLVHGMPVVAAPPPLPDDLPSTEASSE